MSLNSVNTNINAQVALQSLNLTSTQLASTEKRISTGFRVADATDDGAAFAIAQRVRSDVSGLTSVNEQLGNVKGLLDTTNTGLKGASDTFKDINSTLQKLADGNVSGSQRTEYGSQLASLVSEVKNYFQDATYNGKSLIGDIGGGKATAVTTSRNESGGTYGITSFSASAFATSLATLNVTTQTTAQGAITATGLFTRLTDKLGQRLNYYGAASNFVDSQITYNSAKIDSLNSGLGSLIDADLSKESANLQSLQIRQQLGTQALSIANQAPQTLLSLFK